MTWTRRASSYGVVYALAYNGNLTALDLRSGQIMW
ncbi:hypothetical protein ACNKHS_15190 [Shigella flexneri]